MGKVSKEIRQAIYKRDGYRCLQCQCEDDLTIDHVVPLSMGGRNQADNYQTLCRACNVKKGSNIRDLRGLRVVGKLELTTIKVRKKKVIIAEPTNKKVTVLLSAAKPPKEVTDSMQGSLANLKKKYPYAYSLIDRGMWVWIFDNLVKKQ